MLEGNLLAVGPIGFPEILLKRQLFSRGPLFGGPYSVPLPPAGGDSSKLGNSIPPPSSEPKEIFGTDIPEELYGDLDNNLIWGFWGDDYLYGDEEITR